MTDILKRIIKLAKMLGINVAPFSQEIAELKGYAAGLEMIFDDMTLLEQQTYPLTATGNALSLVCNQFGIDGNLSVENKYMMISNGYKQVFGDYVNGALAKELKKYNVRCIGSDGKMILSALTYRNSGIIENMGRIFRNHLSPSTVVVMDGSGLDFDYWDNTTYLFDDYDRLNIPFYILDKLK